jgi:hypothetical protein
MFFGSISKYVTWAMMGSLLVIVAGAGLYYTHTQRELATLRSNEATLRSAVSTQETTIQTFLRASESQNYEISALQTALQNAEQVRRNTEARLRRANLEAMARLDSVDLENRLNRATQLAFEEIVRLTGGTVADDVVSGTPSASPTVGDVQPPPAAPVRNR